ncbi:glycosyltransferase family protein [Streptomyces justiciae]|uniref:hypothetical protein n=1 Tax=Streptomyces justiciae TaxID=2780140 RepID=UPI00187F3915|nr:hypothetical protein [Streptomyces justiciae]MBE8477508.1 hypothetical protein [Streptomyces justiciae]
MTTTEALHREVDAVMAALEDAYADAALTPGGVGWLRVHYVPVRRLVARLARRLLAMHDPTAPCGGPQPLGVAHDSAAIGYVSYDVTDAGVAYVLGLGDEDPPNGPDSTRPQDARLPSGMRSTPVCALSWSSRHAATLLPVLAELADRGIATTVVDASTDPAQRFPEPHTPQITVVPIPDTLFAHHGGPPLKPPSVHPKGPTATVGRHEVSLGRLAHLVSQVLVHSTDCTQPSWSSVLMAERWLHAALATLRPDVLLCSNDTSPLGVLAVAAAERAGASTVYVQHGAWTDGQVGWRAQHCRHVAVMGSRDVLTAHAWTRRTDARTHIVGQPRFDSLADIDRAGQRAYLIELLTKQTGLEPARIAVWACQPFSELRLIDQFDAIAEGLRNTSRRWGLVLAPHPAQGPSALTALLDSAQDIAVAVAAPEVGAHGCLAGADALLSASSTCGIEALLLDVPVLELALPATRTLQLADHGAAQRCQSDAEITVALARIDRTSDTVRVPAAAKHSICRWDGRSAVAVADIVVNAMAEHSTL